MHALLSGSMKLTKMKTSAVIIGLVKWLIQFPFPVFALFFPLIPFQQLSFSYSYIPVFLFIFMSEISFIFLTGKSYLLLNKDVCVSNESRLKSLYLDVCVFENNVFSNEWVCVHYTAKQHPNKQRQYISVLIHCFEIR